MAFFIFTYVGVEVTIGGGSHPISPKWTLLIRIRFMVGWIVTYVINERHGDANSGYISSGFFGGKSLRRSASLTPQMLSLGVQV